VEEEDIYLCDDAVKEYLSYKKRAGYSKRRWLVEDAAAVCA
jgi:hypothetical protein